MKLKKGMITKLGYAFYDFSNSGYVIIFQSFLFPILFANLIKDKVKTPASIWGWAISLSVLLAIVIAPFIGRFADVKSKSRPFAILVTGVGIISFVTSVFISDHMIALMLVFILFNAMFELTQTLYDAFLRDIAKTDEEVTKLSTFAWGFGYLGGILFALIYLILNSIGFQIRYILALSSILYTAFSIFPIVIFWRLDNKYISTVSKQKEVNLIRYIFKSKIPFDIKPLLIYWIIADCVAAILYHSSIFAKTELNISDRTIGILMICVQLLAFPATWYAGKLASKIGIVKTIRGSLVIWCCVLMILYCSTRLIHLIFALVLTALVIGTTQSLLRAHFATKIDSQISGEGFGFFGIANKSASIVSPALVSIAAAITGSIRPAFFILMLFVAVAIYFSKFLNKK